VCVLRRSDQGVVLAAVTAVDAANSSSTAAVATCVTYHLTEFAVDSGSKSSPFNFQPDISSSNGDTLTAHDIFSALKVLLLVTKKLLLPLLRACTTLYELLFTVYDM
jgi:hypothetical protein